MENICLEMNENSVSFFYCLWREFVECLFVVVLTKELCSINNIYNITGIDNSINS